VSQYFDQLLNVYWLRPETALWRAIDINAMKEFSFRSPSLDLGCGDGIFSFIRAGGNFDSTFDAFQAVSNLESFFNKIDIYDIYKNDISPVITQQSQYRIDYAFDHKENLLKKAKSLGLHKEFIVGDANRTLPFNDNTFNSIFSNIIYWLDDPSLALGEIARILRPGGECCIMVPNITFIDFSFYYDLYIKQKDPRFAFLENLDRGRITDNIKHAKDEREWHRLIDKSGLKIVHHGMHLSKTTVQIWDIGMRPLFPVLYKMVSSMNTTLVQDIKKQWIETFSLFLKPFIGLDGELNSDIQPGFHCFILGK